MNIWIFFFTLIFCGLCMNVPILFLIFRTYEHLLGSPDRSGRSYKFKLFLGIAAAVLFPALPILNNIALLAPVSIFVSFFFLPDYPRLFQKKLFIACILITVCTCQLFLSDLLSSYFYQNKLAGIIDASGRNESALVMLWLYLCILFDHVFLGIELYIIRKITTAELYKLPRNIWILFISIPAIIILALTANVVVLYNIIGIERLFSVPVMLAFLVISIICFFLYDRVSAYLRISAEKKQLEQKWETEKYYYQKLEQMQNRIRSLHHDMKNHLQTAAHLAASEQTDKELLEYLKYAQDELHHADTVIHTGNPYIDSIMNLKISEAREHQITVRVKTHIPPGLSISFDQAVIIVGNLMDNAIEANQHLPVSARWIRINTSYTNGSLFLSIANASCNQTHPEADQIPVSTKKDSVLHGLGLKNVEYALKDNGHFKIQATAKSFLVSVVLYMESDFDKN